MSTTEIPNDQSSEHITAKPNHSSSSPSLQYSDSSANMGCTPVDSNSNCSATTGSPSLGIDIACPTTLAKQSSCSKSDLKFTPQPSIVDADIPTTVPRLGSDPDTTDLADRIIVTPTVVNMAIPHIRSVAEHAKGVAVKVFQSLEKFIASESQQVDGSYDPLRKLVQGRPSEISESSEVRFTHKKHLYASIDALVRFIASAAVDIPALHDNTRIRPRKFWTYFGEPPVLENNVPCDWPNAAITLSDEGIPCLSGRSDHWNSLALIEARRSDEEQADALKHLTIYSWNLYADSFERAFVWGFTVCDSNFRACLYSQDNVFVSDAMDVATSEGRMQLVSLLVNMSFCDSSQLGYDTTIRFNPAVGEWEIDVYDDERNTTDVYWLDMVQPLDTAIFGNHTRIIRCLRPGPSARADADSDKGNYICVKDSWTSCDQLTSDRDRDEVYALRRITEELGSDPELEGTFPKLLSGGVVRQKKSPGSIPSPEYTDTLFAALGGDVLKGVPKRVHRRLAETPFALPISQLRSVDELIVVVADAMTAHRAIAERCQILHRDISQNNIMFTRKSDGSVRGVLVDFDTAMPIEDSELESWKPDMRGTLAFMSIGNLTISPLRRTILDDWESLIYVLCWICTFGFSEECGFRSQSDTASLPIKAWESRDCEFAAEAKVSYSSASSTFIILITRSFLPFNGNRCLGELSCDLFNVLFFNENLTCLSHSAIKIHVGENQVLLDHAREQIEMRHMAGWPQFWDYDIACDIVNPFERRQMLKELIANELLNVVQTAKSEALSRLANNY